MRFDSSNDGEMRASIRIVVRVSKPEVEAIKKHLKRIGQPYNDSAVREFVEGCTETLYPSSVLESQEEEE
jgi:hypothetical protein